MAKLQDITIYRKENITLEFSMSPVEDVTGWNTVLTVKRPFKSRPSETFQISGVITDSTNGVFSVTLGSTETDIAAGSYVYDFTRTDANNYIVLSIGQFIIKSGVLTP